MTTPTDNERSEMSQITIKAVVAYAVQLENDAEKQTAQDPYASPYRPQTSYEAVKKLCQRHGGPEGALSYLRARAAMYDREAREHAVVAQKALTVHTQRQGYHRIRREKDRGHLNPGERIDQAIARLRVVASPASSRLDGDIVRGGDRKTSQQWTVDAAERAVAFAMIAVREIENLEDSLKVRDLGKAA